MRHQITKAIGHVPSVKTAAIAMRNFLNSARLSDSDEEALLQLAEMVLQDPSKWAAVRDHLIKVGLVQEQVFPVTFDRRFVTALIAALHIAIKDNAASPLRAVSNV